MNSNGVGLTIVGALTLLMLCEAPGVLAQQVDMSFFVTSAGSGKGGDLGGLRVRTSTVSTWPRRPARAARRGTPT